MRNGTLNGLFCNLCDKLVLGQNHWILHCKTLFDALDYFQPLISELEQAEVEQKELVFSYRRNLTDRCYEISLPLVFDFLYTKIEGQL